MVEVLVEENFARIDGDDMSVILDLLGGLDLEAEPTAPRNISEGHRWTLALHWLQEGPVSADTEAGLRGVVPEVQGHFATAGRVPPAEAAVYGPDGEVLLRL